MYKYDTEDASKVRSMYIQNTCLPSSSRTIFENGTKLLIKLLYCPDYCPYTTVRKMLRIINNRSIRYGRIALRH